jgi:hypothetical protein
VLALAPGSALAKHHRHHAGSPTTAVHHASAKHHRHHVRPPRPAVQQAPAKHHHHHVTPPPPAVEQVLKDCNDHNHLTRHYPLSVLQQAQRDMPTDQREYSTCGVEIQNAIQALLGGHVRQPPKTPPAVTQHIAQAAPTELHQAAQAGAQPVKLGGTSLAAGTVNVNGSSLFGALPAPILAVLAALLALGAVPLILRLRSVVRTHRGR